jgi:hypothetical protein
VGSARQGTRGRRIRVDTGLDVRRMLSDLFTKVERHADDEPL